MFPSEDALLPVITDIRHINPQAVLITSTQSSVPIEEILNLKSFDVRKYQQDKDGEKFDGGMKREMSKINITRGVFHIETDSEGKIIPSKKKKKTNPSSINFPSTDDVVIAETIDVRDTVHEKKDEKESGRVSTISLTSKKSLDLNRFNRWISTFLKAKGNDIYRFKGE